MSGVVGAEESPHRSGAKRLRLGLIGEDIARSLSPNLHRLAGRLCGIDVSYELMTPGASGAEFDAVFDACRDGAFRGVNVTHPYKERVASRVAVEDPVIRRIGSVNTVVFEPGGAKGHNTDHTGFIAAYRSAFGARAPGAVGVIGAGGVGRAIAFALVLLGADELRLVDRDRTKADALAAAIREASGGRVDVAVGDVSTASTLRANAVVNCTPVGMGGLSGSPVPADWFAGTEWAFDSVYTPVETKFKKDAEAAGAQFLSGYELFFHQGVQAFQIFAGTKPADLAALRRMLGSG
jgi:quinate/shikimate dehydrogenase (NAD+)